VDSGVALVLSALVGLVGSVLVTLIQRSRKENKDDHALVVEHQRLIYKTVIDLDKKIDRHIEDHQVIEISK
jgi:hypothetical protein